MLAAGSDARPPDSGPECELREGVPGGGEFLNRAVEEGGVVCRGVVLGDVGVELVHWRTFEGNHLGFV